MHYCIFFPSESKLQMAMQSPSHSDILVALKSSTSSTMGVTEVSYVNHSSDRLQANEHAPL